MPELPEVETVIRGLMPVMTGRRLDRLQLNRPDLRWPLPAGLAERVAGRRILGLRRRAKYILMDLEGGLSLIAHLGMSGRLILHGSAAALPEPGRHDHVLWHLEDGAVVVLTDPRRFGMLTDHPTSELPAHPWLTALGPEPLSDAFTGEALAAALARRKPAVKLRLMDQRVVVGVGNIYASEALFRAGVDPSRPAGAVEAAEAEAIVAAVKAVLAEAIAAGGSSLRDYVQASGELGYFQHAWAVYGREGEPCPGCDCGDGQGVRKRVLGGRASYWCAARQR